MKKCLYILFLGVSLFGLFAQTTDDQESDKEKCAQLVYLEESSEIKIINPIETEYLVQIYNLTGIVVKQVENVKPEVSKINVSELIKGIYLVKITPVPNLPSATFKVVIR